MTTKAKATAQAEQPTVVETSAPVVKRQREKIPYAHPTRPTWLVAGDTEIIDVETTATEETPSKRAGEKFYYKAEVLTVSGLRKVLDNNPMLALDLCNKNVVYRDTNQSARKHGVGEYRPDWSALPGEKGEKSSKEREEFIKMAMSFGADEVTAQQKWLEFKANRKAK